MTRTARAAVLVAPRRMELRELPLPQITDGDGLMRIEACGVCASDVPVYRGESDFELPVILGHEIVGRVAEIGPEAARRWNVNEGDRIVVERWIPCGHCDLCYAGAYRQCVPVVDGHRRFYGGAPTTLAPGLWGGYADYLYLSPDAVVYKVADDVDRLQVPLFTPLANALDWVGRVAGVRPGQAVVIEGAGQEGLAAVMASVALGASTIIVTGLAQDERRLAVARRLGATATIDIETTDPFEAVRDLTDGAMADAVFDLTSTASVGPLATAVDVAGNGATIVTPSMHGARDVPLDVDAIIRKTLTIKGVWGRERSAIFAALRLLERGGIGAEHLITHHFALSEADEALRTVAREVNADALHVSVTPD